MSGPLNSLQSSDMAQACITAKHGELGTTTAADVAFVKRVENAATLGVLGRAKAIAYNAVIAFTGSETVEKMKAASVAGSMVAHQDANDHGCLKVSKK